MSLRKDMERVVAEAERQGWRVEKTGSGHWKLLAPDGYGIVIASSTPSAQSAIRKTVGQLRRHGFIWKGR